MLKLKDISRYHFIVNKYHAILNKDSFKIDNVETLRNLYDNLFKDDLSKNYIVDGELFRKEGVDIFKRDGSLKHIDTGIYPESLIIEKLNDLIDFLKDESHSFFIKAAVAHYYIVYVHPFYDGNGRFTRYITSALLANKNKILALKLSKFINKSIKEYDRNIYDVCSDYNRGDLTPFICCFLEILFKASQEIQKELNNYYSLDVFKVRESLVSERGLIKLSSNIKKEMRVFNETVNC